MKKTTSSLLVAAGLTALVASPQAASADTVPMANLPVTPPVVKIPVSSSTTPDKIQASEHVDGIYPAMLPLAKRKQAEDQGYRVVTIFNSEKEAQTYATDGTQVNNQLYESSSPRTCMTRWGSMTPRVAYSYRFKPYEPPKPTPAQIAMLVKQHRWPPPKPKPVPKPTKPVVEKDAVYSIHLERLGPATDTLTVETIDAYVDLQTMGARLVSKSSEKLARVGTGPNGIGVYAARDDSGKSDFLVLGPDLPAPASAADRQAQVSSLASTASRLLAQIPSGSQSIGCGYARFSLEAKPGSGQMATVFANAFLPPAPDPSDADNAEPPAQSDSDDDGEQMREELEQQARTNRSQRSRPVAINVSLSQLTSEPAPLLSVTFGWAGKDQRLSF
jgi:hypothetical protein